MKSLVVAKVILAKIDTSRESREKVIGTEQETIGHIHQEQGGLEEKEPTCPKCICEKGWNGVQDGNILNKYLFYSPWLSASLLCIYR